MIRRGFTIVELIITITIMAILLTLAVVNLDASQVNGRDAERKADVEALALNLESFYTNKDLSATGSGGNYPGTMSMTSAEIRNSLPDSDPKNLRAPDVATTSPMSVVVATNTLTTVTGILPLPSTSNDVYVYQPLTVNGALCVDPVANGCRRFNLYYLNEKNGTVEKITSKHQ